MPTDSQRSVFNNLIQYAEVHPTKVRLGVWAPAQNNNSNPEAATPRTGVRGVVAEGLLEHDAEATGGPSGSDSNFKNNFEFAGVEVGCSTTVLNGGQVSEVGERNISDCLVLVLEIETYPEPKFLSVHELRALKLTLGTNERVAEHIQGTESLVRDKFLAAKKGGPLRRR